MLVRHAVHTYAKQTQTKDPMAVVVEALAKEQKASRRKRKGQQDESSSEVDEAEGNDFDMCGSMKKYGLAQIPNIHTQKTKRIEEAAKRAKKVYRKKKRFLAAGPLQEYAPQWMGDKQPKGFRSDGMTHAHWVAAWWSRTLTQLAAQGSAEVETLSFETLLTEFLNANKVAIEKGTKAAWELDRHIWDTVAEKASRKDLSLDVVKEFSTVDENELSAIQKKIQATSGNRWTKGGYQDMEKIGKGGGSASSWDSKADSWKGQRQGWGKGGKSGKDKDKSKGKK